MTVYICKNPLSCTLKIKYTLQQGGYNLIFFKKILMSFSYHQENFVLSEQGVRLAQVTSGIT